MITYMRPGDALDEEIWERTHHEGGPQQVFQGRDHDGKIVIGFSRRWHHRAELTGRCGCRDHALEHQARAPYMCTRLGCECQGFTKPH